jgi:hypothetical protein
MQHRNIMLRLSTMQHRNIMLRLPVQSDKFAEKFIILKVRAGVHVLKDATDYKDTTRLALV